MMFFRFPVLMLLFPGMLLAGTAAAADVDTYRVQRKQLLREIEADVRATSRQIGRKQLSGLVMEAMASVPRHAFVPKRLRRAAYENRPLPIGHGQTISQPYIVAIMTDLLDVEETDTVLEVGTGSGYQAAVLSHLVKQVHTIEIIEPLAKQAKTRLADLGYENVSVRIGDGYYGVEAHAPFDAIIVTAAANQIPPPLVKQLKPGGKMIIPVGGAFLTQQLVLVEKSQAGDVSTKQLLPVVFVPLTGGH
jgi:protein-L-isoaspartate(D-aspartate) O-methyltransferase